MTKRLLVFRSLFIYSSIRTTKTTTRLNKKKDLKNYGATHHASTHIEHVASIDAIGPTNYAKLIGAGIICTIGPASREVKTLVKLIDNGMTIARLNFSHGSKEYHLESLKNIRKAVEIFSEIRQRTIPVGIALDTKGPEIRTGILEAGKDKLIELKEGGEITVTTDEIFSKKVNESVIYVDYKNITNIVSPGAYIYIDDGLISLKVKKIEGKNITCFIEDGGMLGSSKGVNLPGMNVDLPAVSVKDKDDIKFAMAHHIDMIFASFIRSKEGVQEIKKLTNTGDDRKNMAIIAKIENLQGLENLDEIIEVSDGLMVARGDMGIELPSEKVFLVQKSMIAKCNLAGKPVICATQMLESMIHVPRPTRAETSDVANAVLDGADCVMLSGETAKGKYPVECVKLMKKLCAEAEAVVPYRQLFMDLQKYIHTPTPIATSTAIAGVNAAEKSSAKAILVITASGATAFMVSRFRPPCPIIAITRHPSVARKCLLYRGVVPALHEEPKLEDWPKDTDARIRTGLFVAFQRNIISEGDTVIFLTGWKKGRGATNTMRIMKVTKDLLNF